MIEALVAEALERIPFELDNCAVIVEDRHPRGLLGLWQRHPWGGCTITLYEHSILLHANEDNPAALVEHVLRHEVGHHLGLTHADMALA